MIDLKKYFSVISILIVFFFLSCKDEVHDKILVDQQIKQDSINKTPEGKASKVPKDKFETIMYEGCEYIIYKEQPANNRALGYMAHKGNCSNPIHQ